MITAIEVRNLLADRDTADIESPEGRDRRACEARPGATSADCERAGRMTVCPSLRGACSTGARPSPVSKGRFLLGGRSVPHRSRQQEGQSGGRTYAHAALTSARPRSARSAPRVRGSWRANGGVRSARSPRNAAPRGSGTPRMPPPEPLHGGEAPIITVGSSARIRAARDRGARGGNRTPPDPPGAAFAGYLRANHAASPGRPGTALSCSADGRGAPVDGRHGSSPLVGAAAA